MQKTRRPQLPQLEQRAAIYGNYNRASRTTWRGSGLISSLWSLADFAIVLLLIFGRALGVSGNHRAGKGVELGTFTHVRVNNCLSSLDHAFPPTCSDLLGEFLSFIFYAEGWHPSVYTRDTRIHKKS